MSDYLSKEDSSSDEEAPVCTLDETQIAEIRETCAGLKGEGNTFFSAKEYESAVGKYTVSVGYALVTSLHDIMSFRCFVCRKLLNF